MLYGTVDLGLKNGGSASLEWAGRAKIAKSSADGKWRMRFYQVYLVSRLGEMESLSLLLTKYRRTLGQQTLIRSEVIAITYIDNHLIITRSFLHFI